MGLARGTYIRHQTVSAPKSESLFCGNCDGEIGYKDHHSDGFRLLKWHLRIRSPGSVLTTNGEHVISSHLSSIMHLSCCSRLLLAPRSWVPQDTSFTASQAAPPSGLQSTTKRSLSSEIKLASSPQRPVSTPNGSKSSNGETKTSTAPFFISLWVLTPSIRCSTTARNLSSSTSQQNKPSRIHGQLAMKVFWKPVTEVQATTLLDDDGVEEVFLPQDVILEMKGCLAKSANVLPPSARKFKDWDVGLWERFEENLL